MYKVMASGRKVIDPTYILTGENSPTETKDQPFTSTSGLSNDTDSMCPKCKATMTEVFIDASNKVLSNNMFIGQSGYQPEPVYFCPSCRVTNPKMDS